MLEVLQKGSDKNHIHYSSSSANRAPYPLTLLQIALILRLCSTLPNPVQPILFHRLLLTLIDLDVWRFKLPNPNGLERLVLRRSPMQGLDEGWKCDCYSCRRQCDPTRSGQVAQSHKKSRPRECGQLFTRHLVPIPVAFSRHPHRTPSVFLPGADSSTFEIQHLFPPLFSSNSIGILQPSRVQNPFFLLFTLYTLVQDF